MRWPRHSGPTSRLALSWLHFSDLICSPNWAQGDTSSSPCLPAPSPQTHSSSTGSSLPCLSFRRVKEFTTHQRRKKLPFWVILCLFHPSLWVIPFPSKLPTPMSPCPHPWCVLRTKSDGRREGLTVLTVGDSPEISPARSTNTHVHAGGQGHGTEHLDTVRPYGGTCTVLGSLPFTFSLHPHSRPLMRVLGPFFFSFLLFRFFKLRLTAGTYQLVEIRFECRSAWLQSPPKVKENLSQWTLNSTKALHSLLVWIH